MSVHRRKKRPPAEGAKLLVEFIVAANARGLIVDIEHSDVDRVSVSLFLRKRGSPYPSLVGGCSIDLVAYGVNATGLAILIWNDDLGLAPAYAADFFLNTPEALTGLKRDLDAEMAARRAAEKEKL